MSIENSEDGIVYINVEEGLERMMHNKDLYVKLLKKLKTDSHFKDLTAALTAQDYEKAQTAAHAVKGMAANLSLTELLAHTLRLEAQIKNRAIPANAVESMDRCLEQTLIHIDTVLVRYG
ncbi:MAG: Hpt domain-containing protein [Treponema sp.]|jgi:HPt (histidine-containing phosphotransfer) domain-containing protein|nr:Hpt domain-containing protein [Treponema sp.]